MAEMTNRQLPDNLPRSSYAVGPVQVPVFLIGDRDFHNATAIWGGCYSPSGKSPENYLRSMEGQKYLAEVARIAGVEASRLFFRDQHGHWWFTQLVTFAFAGWISPQYGVAIHQLAAVAVRLLRNRRDPAWQEVREQTKEECRKPFNNAVHKWRPIPFKGKDIKHGVATNKTYVSLFGKKADELKRAMGLSRKASLRDHLTASQLQALGLVEISVAEKSEKANITDPDRGLRCIEAVGAVVRRARIEIESINP
jgi:hypothetical protein